MKVSKHCGIFVLLLIGTIFDQIEGNEPPKNSCGDWHSYKDEWCYKIPDDRLLTFDEAKDSCAQIKDDDPVNLAIIRSKEEQDFLTNYLFTTEKKVENFWIGARFDSNKYHWIDNSDLGYTNWVKSTKNKTNYCVQMQSEEDSVGKWIDEPCGQKKLVVCQKIQWTPARLLKAKDEAQSQKKDSIDEVNKKIQAQDQNIYEANKAIEEANQKIAQQKHKIEEANQKITEHKHEIEQANSNFEARMQKIDKIYLNFNSVAFKNCGKQEILALHINESSCSSGICTIHKGKPYKFEMKFVANQDSKTVQMRQMGHINGLDIPITPNVDNIKLDGCNYFRCPLVRGQEYSFIEDKFQFTNVFPDIKIEFKITLIGDHGELTCSSFNLDIVR